jgi:hypothetical protein
MVQIRSAWVGLVVMGLALTPYSAWAAAATDLTSECQALLNDQWDALAERNYDSANKILDRARQKGCLRQPVAGRLCDIPAGQEAKYDAKGDASLVNIARNQQRLLGCEM